jgi:hypothetical protein
MPLLAAPETVEPKGAATAVSEPESIDSDLPGRDAVGDRGRFSPHQHSRSRIHDTGL